MNYSRLGPESMSSIERQKMNSIHKVLAVMQALSSPDGPHRLSEIADRAQIKRPSAHRILQVLTEMNYAAPTGDGFYSSGLAMRALVGPARGDAVTEAAPTLDALQRSTGHTVHFAAFVGTSAVYISKFEGDKPYQMASRVGMHLELHCTSIGKSILAALPRDEADQLLQAKLGTGEAGLVKIHEDLDRIADLGFALDDEENEPKIRCVGASVLDRLGQPIGGVSVSGLAFVLDVPELMTLGPRVAAAANDISMLLDFDMSKPFQE